MIITAIMGQLFLSVVKPPVTALQSANANTHALSKYDGEEEGGGEKSQNESTSRSNLAP